MKKYLTLMSAGAILLCLASAFGCGTTNDTTAQTTPRATTSQTTETTETTHMTTERTTEETMPILTDPATSDRVDPNMTLPDIDNPITDIEPNIPESGVGDHGGMDDMFDGDMFGDMNGTNDAGNNNGTNGSNHNGMNGSNNNGTNGNGDMGARGRGRRDSNASNPALPTK